ncbi:MAG: ParB/Srx family N-terminal domain-containing protein [Lachnospiraceae bacterium]
MKKVTMKLSQIHRPEKNVRIHTEKQLQEFERSVRMFGQMRPIVIDEDNMILAGNGLYETLSRMGWEKAECYQYADLTANQKKKLMIADNKIFSLGIDNLETLNTFLEDLQGDLDVPGFDEEILRQMVSDAEEVTEKISEYGTLDADEIRSIQENNEKREQRQAAPAAFTVDTSSETDNQEPAGVPPDHQEAADIQRYVICSGCGEKIWL